MGIGQQRRKLLKHPKHSDCGFRFKETISECSWMHPKIKRFGKLHKGCRGLFIYKNEGAWLDTPLHFSSWLLQRRQQKQRKALLTKERKKHYGREYKKQRWANDQEFRIRSVERQKLHRKNNLRHRQYMRDYRRKQRQDFGLRLKQNARSRFWKVMQGVKKDIVTDSFNLFIGCSAAFLKGYIEKQFSPTMSWNNYGAVWEVDHKIPLKNFDLKNQDQAKAAFHFSNLQPATTSYNRSKQARWSDI